MLDYTAAEVAANAALRIAEKFAEKYPEDPQMQRDLSVSYERLGGIAVYREAINRLFVSSSEGFSAVGAAAKANRKIDGSTYSYSWDAEIRTITIKFKFKNR